MKPGTKYTVFSIRKQKAGDTTWVRAGSAWMNRDGSMNVYLDVLPLDGTLHIREATPGEAPQRDLLAEEAERENK